jgi:hypothetical protein
MIGDMNDEVKWVVVDRASVEAAKVTLARNEARGRPTDELTRRLASAKTITSRKTGRNHG